MSPLLDNLTSGWALVALGLILLLLLGRGLLRGRAASRQTRNPVRGLNYLLNEAPDTDLDALAAGLEVNDATLDAHLALGTLLRRRGEIDRAIRLHQGLLAGPRLGVEGRGRVELELARDYLAAGLLNRAESLLRQLIKQEPMRRPALEQMLEVHQRERDWHAAADVARQLAAEHGDAVTRTLAHYLCELADDAWQAGDLTGARRHLTEALERDPLCVRASLLVGRLELEAGHYREAIGALQRVREQDPRFLPEVLPQLMTAHRELGSDRDLLRFLETSLEQHASAQLASELAQHHVRAGDPERARRLLIATLSRRPTLRGLQVLLSHHLPLFDEPAAAALKELEAYSARLIDAVDRYVCEACGFSGPVLHWQCPGCKAWGTTAPRDGIFSD
ncbi:MAG: lipopolysaccharide assembly protein LapB [Gammaproteobacteria bacterium]|nr:lipopolysaccharide assembly protein LapB [Gammaproteobacteria bacterium]